MAPSSTNSSKGDSSGRTLSSLPTPLLTDWSGLTLHKKKEVLNLLYPTCIVRAVVENHDTGAVEAIYFHLVKVKDGTFWGKTLDTYRSDDYIDLPDGKVFAFPMKDVMEVPITRQPKSLRRKLEKYLDTAGMGRAVTGVWF